MIVVSDASPLNILVRIGYVDVLPPLFGEVYVAPRVVGELMHAEAPSAVRAWIMAPPVWLHCRAPSTLLDAAARGAGEREAISLAVELKAALLLIDDRKARQDARRFGVPITGTLEGAGTGGRASAGLAARRGGAAAHNRLSCQRRTARRGPTAPPAAAAGLSARRPPLTPPAASSSSRRRCLPTRWSTWRALPRASWRSWGCDGRTSA